MRATTRKDLATAALCVGVMAAGAMLVGGIPFRRTAAAVRHLSLSPKLHDCSSRRGEVQDAPDVYVVPAMGFDNTRALEVVGYLEDTLKLSVTLTPPMKTCAGCVSEDHEAKLERVYEAVDAHIPELRRHKGTLRLALFESDVSGEASPFGGRSVRVPVAVVSTSHLGDGEASEDRLHKLSARYAARMVMRCSYSGDSRSFMYSTPPQTHDDIDVMQHPDI